MCACLLGRTLFQAATNKHREYTGIQRTAISKKGEAQIRPGWPDALLTGGLTRGLVAHEAMLVCWGVGRTLASHIARKLTHVALPKVAFSRAIR